MLAVRERVEGVRATDDADHVTVAEQDGLLHAIEKVWGPGSKARAKVGMRSSWARCGINVYDKLKHEYFDGLPTCIECTLVVLGAR